MFKISFIGKTSRNQNSYFILKILIYIYIYICVSALVCEPSSLNVYDPIYLDI